jgi:hypothetical protein
MISLHRPTLLLIFPLLLGMPACASTAPSGASGQERITSVGMFDVVRDANPMVATYPQYGDGMLAWGCSFPDGGRTVFLGLTGPVRYATDYVLVRYAFGYEDLSDPEPWLISRRSGFPLAYLQPDEVARFTEQTFRHDEVHIEATDPASRQTIPYRFLLYGGRDAIPMLRCPRA